MNSSILYYKFRMLISKIKQFKIQNFQDGRVPKCKNVQIFKMQIRKNKTSRKCVLFFLGFSKEFGIFKVHN